MKKFKNNVNQFDGKWLIGHSQSLLLALPVVILIFLSALPASGARIKYNTSWHLFDYDVKHYTTKIVPQGPSYKESVMAGTQFDQNYEHGVPHFMRLDGGTGLVSVGAPGIITQKLYPDPLFVEQRVVDLVVEDVGKYYMVILAREDATQIPGAQDKIKIIGVDDAGAPFLEFVLNDLTTDYNLYPMSALYNEPKDMSGDVRKLLYVCGYATSTSNSIYPGEPNYYTPKQSFIMSVDIDPISPDYMTVINVKYFETSPGANPDELDWDMGMRLQVLQKNSNPIVMGSDQPYSNAIVMTGSVNFMTGMYNPNIVRSGTALYILDPWSLNQRIGGSTHITDLRVNEDGGGLMEYGVGVAESNDGEDMYIISNIYNGYGAQTEAPDDWYNLGGNIIVWPPPSYNVGPYNAKADRMAITHANNWFNTVLSGVSTTRKIITEAGKGLYGVQILPSIASSTRGATGTRFVVAGMAIDRSQSTSCSFMWPLSVYSNVNPTNIIPFLWDVDIDFTETPGTTNILGTIDYTPFDFSSPPSPSTIIYFKNQTTTGDPATGADPNAYAVLGGGMSHIFYGPKFADRSLLAPDGAIAMNAPKFGQEVTVDADDPDPLPPRLGLKTIMVGDNNGSYFLEGGCITGCGLEMMDTEIETIADQNSTPTIKLVVASLNNPGDMNYTVNGDCSNTQGLGSVYKSTNIHNVSKEKAVILYPNPASSSVNVMLGTSIDPNSNVKIELVNMQGQLIKTLFDGTASALDLNHTLQLPHVAQGLYMVNIYANGKREHIQKLNIR